MKNYKIDIKEITEHLNNTVKKCNVMNHGVTQKEMSEMVQKHAFKLGYYNQYKNNEISGLNCNHIYLYIDSCIKFGLSVPDFDIRKNEKIGLEFFSINPEKMVTVKMPEEDYSFMKESKLVKDNLNINIDKWELVE